MYRQILLYKHAHYPVYTKVTSACFNDQSLWYINSQLVQGIECGASITIMTGSAHLVLRLRLVVVDILKRQLPWESMYFRMLLSANHALRWYIIAIIIVSSA